MPDKPCQHLSGKALRRWVLTLVKPLRMAVFILILPVTYMRPSAFLVNKLLPALKAGNPEEKIWNFDYPAAAKMFDTAAGAKWTQRHDHVPNASQSGQRRSSARSQHS